MKNILKPIKNLFSRVRTQTVLVIDDSPIDRRVAESFLEKHYFVRLAVGGREGVELAREIRPDLILLDFMMPQMKGPDVCRVLREDERTRDIPVIFLTSMDTPATVVDSFSEGADIFLTKPVKRQELINQVALTLKMALPRM